MASESQPEGPFAGDHIPGGAAQGLVTRSCLWRPSVTADDVVGHLLAAYVVGALVVQVTNPDPDLLDRRRWVAAKTTRG